MTALYYEDYDRDWSFTTAVRTISDADIRAFVELHGFQTPTFTDMSYVQAAPDYGGRMAPGLLVLCMAEGLVLHAGLTRRRGIFLLELSPKFLKPVFAGDSIVNHVRLESKRPTRKPDRGIVVTAHEVHTDKGEVALRYTSTRMIRTRLFADPEPSDAS